MLALIFNIHELCLAFNEAMNSCFLSGNVHSQCLLSEGAPPSFTLLVSSYIETNKYIKCFKFKHCKCWKLHNVTLDVAFLCFLFLELPLTHQELFSFMPGYLIRWGCGGVNLCSDCTAAYFWTRTQYRKI